MIFAARMQARPLLSCDVWPAVTSVYCVETAKDIAIVATEYK